MIYLRYYIAGMYKFRTTGFKTKPEYWDAKKQRMLPDAPDAALTNKRLDRMMEAAFGAFCDYDGPRSSAKLDELLDRTYVCERDAAFITPFEQYAGKVNDKRFNDGKLQYRAWYDKKNYIKAFVGTYTISNPSEDKFAVASLKFTSVDDANKSFVMNITFPAESGKE